MNLWYPAKSPRVWSVVLLGATALLGLAILKRETKTKPATRGEPEQTRPLVALLLKCPGPTVSPGNEWRKKVVQVEQRIPKGSSKGLESDLVFPDDRDGTVGAIYGGDVWVRLTHPRHADLKITLGAFARGGDEKSLITGVLWDGPRAARGMPVADADHLDASYSPRADSLLSVPRARRWRLTVTDEGHGAAGLLHEWGLKFLVGRLPFAHDRAYYRQLLFGDSHTRDPLHFPNVVDYFREVSGDKFSFRDAGVYGPATWDGSDNSPRQERCVAVARLLESQGCDFRRFDTNHDGIISVFELTVLVISNERDVGVGRADTDRNGTQLEISQLRVAPGITFVTHSVDFESLTHELSHALSPKIYDLYGDLGSSPGLTLMSLTMGNPADDKKSLYLDAWHRLKFGWISQVLEPSGSAEAGFIELLSELTARSRGSRPCVLIIRNPRAGDPEYFVFEYRDGSGYDNGVGDRGIVAWHVREDGQGKPFVPEGGSGTPADSVYAVGPDSRHGARRAWKASDSRFRLHWADGSLLPQTFWVEALSTGEGGAVLRWNAMERTDGAVP